MSPGGLFLDISMPNNEVVEIFGRESDFYGFYYYCYYYHYSNLFFFFHLGMLNIGLHLNNLISVLCRYFKSAYTIFSWQSCFSSSFEVQL